MCQRLTDCKLASYTPTCLDTCKRYGYEASEAGRTQLLTLTRYSCQQIQSAVAAGADTHQRPPSSTRTASPRPSSTPGANNNDIDELNRLEKELNDLDRQLGKDSVELERRSRGARGPVRGAVPPRGPAAPERRVAPAGGAGYAGQGRRPAQSGSARWTCNAEGSSVYGYNVASGGGDVRGRSTVSIPGNGSSRDEAAYAAMSSCGSLMTTNLSTDRSMVLDASEGQWGVRIEVACHVTRCAPM